MSKRFFVETPICESRATLVDSQAHHLIHVMRARQGDQIVLFDGSGAEFTAKVADVSRSAVELEVIDCRQVDRELSFSLTMGVALPKGDRQRWLVEKCTELGVTQLVPLVSQRGVAEPVEAALRRLRRTVIETSKQCGRNRLMQVLSPCSAADFFTAASPRACRLLAHPDGKSMVGPPADAAEIYAAVGPEGGFAEDEVAAANSAGWQPVQLGRRTLRVETAAVALAALLAAHDTQPPSL